MRDIVHQHGGFTSLKWFISHMPRYEKILKKYGPLRTHFLATEISVLNGCAYCIYGHAYALQLHYFRQYNTLVPLDEHEFLAMANASQPDKINQLRGLLNDSELTHEKHDFEEMLSLYSSESQVQGELSSDIYHLIVMFRFLNLCGIQGCTNPDGPHDPINKDLALQSEYAIARSDSRAGAKIAVSHL